MPRKRTSPPRIPKKGEKGGIGVIYARYSSHNQKDISIEQQVTLCKMLAAERGIEIKEVYADRAVSGKSDKRPAFQKMLKDSEHGTFQYVISWKSSRIGRNMLEAMVNECRLGENGVRIAYVEEDFDDTAAGRFAKRSMMNVNQFYIENMAEDVIRGMNSNAERCLVNGPAPFGYKIDGQHYVIDEPAAAIVREIYERTALGEPFVDIYNDLNRRGLRTRKGGEWGRTSFQAILHNEKYRGMYIFGSVRVENGMPQIITDELYYKVQEVLKMKKNPQGRHRLNGDYMLTGKLFCGHCKKAMVGISGTGTNGTMHYYYTCLGKRQHSGCDKKNIRRDFIELEVARGIADYVLQDEMINWIAEATVNYHKEHRDNTDFDNLKTQMSDVELSISNLLKAVEEGLNSESVKARLKELEQEKKRIKSDLFEITANYPEVTKQEVVTWLNSLKGGDIHDKAFQSELFNTFISAVYLYDDKRVKIVFGMPGGGKFTENTLPDDIDDLGEDVRISSNEGHQHTPRGVAI
ncbi:MAG: recombinase family protein [Ruminiclostridium sp.]|nr:recombinase family protein [Ruminiclostridium sp.]